MIRRYCDCCGEEILQDKNDVGPNRLMAKVPSKVTPNVELRVAVITAQGSSWNVGDYCKHCVLDALLELDDRPRANPGHDNSN